MTVLYQLPDSGAALTVADVEALVAGSADDRVRRPAAAWLRAYRLARWLAFDEHHAQLQASAAWDRAADDYAATTAITLVEAN